MTIYIPEKVKVIMNKLNQAGYQAFVAGGCLRNIFLGHEPINWDLVTSALPSDMIMIFDRREGFEAIPGDYDAGNIDLIYNDESYKVNTFKSGKPRKFSDHIEEHLQYNDFTINAMAYNDETGLVDPYLGLNDIQDKILRCPVNTEERLAEDPARMLRAVRFETMLSFALHEEIIQVIGQKKNSLLQAAAEDIGNEFTQMILAPGPSKCIRRLVELGLMEHLIPEILPALGFDQKSSFHDQDVFEHTMAVLDHTKPNLALRLAALLHDIGKPVSFSVDSAGEGHFYGHAGSGSDMARDILTRLNYDSQIVEQVVKLVKEHMNTYDDVSDFSIRKLINRVGADNLDNLFDLQLANIISNRLSGREPARYENIRNRCWEVLSRRQQLTVRDLDINGYDLLEMGYQDKEIGDILQYLLDRVKDLPRYNEKIILKAWARERYNWQDQK